MSKKTTRKPTHKCNHYWFYKHTIWGTGRWNEIAIGRYCTCGRMQTAVISEKDWHPIPKGYVDMRETLEKEMKA